MADQNRNSLILSLRHYIEYHASQFARYNPHILPDLLSSCWISAIRAVDRYTPTKGATLITYVLRRVHGTCQDFFRDNDHLPRSVRLKLKSTPADPLTLTHRRSVPLPIPTAPSHAPAIEAHIDISRIPFRQLLTPRQLFVLQSRFYDEITLKEIGQRLGVIESRAWQIEKEALAIIRTHLLLPKLNRVNYSTQESHL